MAVYCEIHPGRDWKTSCQMCHRTKLWDDDYSREVLKLFPPRICRDLNKVQYPEKRINDDLRFLKEPGNHFYFTGPVGTGKSLYAAALTLAAMRAAYIERSYTNKPVLVSTPTLLQNLKSSFSGGGLSSSALIELYQNADWLVMDDLAVEKTTDWSFEVLYIIINHRYDYDKTTIFTSNLSVAALTEKLGDDRIPSRIGSMCQVRVFKAE